MVVGLETNLAAVLQPMPVHTCFDPTGHGLLQDYIGKISIFVQQSTLQLWKTVLKSSNCMYACNIEVDPQIQIQPYRSMYYQSGWCHTWIPNKQGL